MKRFGISVFTFVGALTVVTFGAGSACAGIFVTEQADWNRGLFAGGGATVNFFDGNGAPGVTYVNQVTPGGPLPGSQFVAVGAVVISSLTTSPPPGGPSVNPIATGASSHAVAIFAVQGNLTPGLGGAVTVNFTDGRMTIHQIGADTFNQNDVSTWGFGNSTIAEFLLKAPEPVISGDGFQIGGGGLSADEINTLSATIAIGQLLSGNFLFKEGTPNNLITTTTGDPGFDAEGLLAIFAETITAGSGSTPSSAALLNTIASAAGLGFGIVPGFANFGSGTHTDFLPFIVNGDFRTTTTLSNAAPGREFDPPLVPEPASVLLWGLALGGLGLSRRIRALRGSK